MRIIPAIDIIDGKCVRLTQGDYSQKTVYNKDPLEVAQQFEDAGLKYLHLVDLDGAKAKHIVNWKVLNNISNKTSLTVDFGGGIKTDEDIKIAFENGAQQVTCGSIAAQSPETFLGWLNKYGSQRIILGADARNGMIATQGWETSTDIEVNQFIENYLKKGIQYVICTDISKDGMLNGPAFDIYKNILKTNPKIKLIASGGISSIMDVKELVKSGLEGAIIGKAIYENRITLEDLSALC